MALHLISAMANSPAPIDINILWAIRSCV